jgi:hypothetical protein
VGGLKVRETCDVGMVTLGWVFTVVVVFVCGVGGGGLFAVVGR